MAKKWVSLRKATKSGLSKGQIFRVGSREVALFQVGEEYHAVDNACPHQGGPLGEGAIDGEVVTCPWHAWKYNVRSGCAVSTPSIQTYPVRVRRGQIQISMECESKQERVEIAPGPGQEILEKLQRCKTLEQVSSLLYRDLKEFLPHNRLGIALLDSVGRLVQVQTRSDRPIFLDNGYSASIQGSSLERLFQEEEVRTVGDLEEHFARRPSVWTQLILKEGMRSSLTLPLLVQGNPIGVVFFSSVQTHAFDESHVGLLKQIVGQLSVSIEQGRFVSDLARSHEQYRILFEMLNDGVFMCRGLSEPFLTLHPNLSHWLGYEQPALKVQSFQSLVLPEEWEKVRQANEQLVGIGDSCTLATVLRKRSGGKLPVEVRFVRVDAQGEPGVMGVVRNLSEVLALNEQLASQQSLGKLIGKNRKMQEIYKLIRQVAPLSTTVLVTGESGTGKELIARAIHNLSQRSDKELVSVNCGALSEQLLESEWFGHEKGAFTGAIQQRMGRFELADGGTLFLDEIGELTPATQVKLLRVLQEGEFERVGSSQTLRVDVRIVAATHRDLLAEVKAGRFREDLYYRLHVMRMEAPPLRERKDDIPMLLKHCMEKLSRMMGKDIQSVSPDALAVLMDYDFPGNVRQLENIVEHAFVRCEGHVVEVAHLPPEVRGGKDDIVEEAMKSPSPLAALEREVIRRVLELCNGDQKLAAERLGISRTTMWRKVKQLESSSCSPG